MSPSNTYISPINIFLCQVFDILNKCTGFFTVRYIINFIQFILNHTIRICSSRISFFYCPTNIRSHSYGQIFNHTSFICVKISIKQSRMLLNPIDCQDIKQKYFDCLPKSDSAKYPSISLGNRSSTVSLYPVHVTLLLSNIFLKVTTGTLVLLTIVLDSRSPWRNFTVFAIIFSIISFSCLFSEKEEKFVQQDSHSEQLCMIT